MKTTKKLFRIWISISPFNKIIHCFAFCKTCVLAVLLLMTNACADGLIIPDPVPDVPQVHIEPFSIKYHHVNVSINNQYTKTEVDQVFHNENHRDLEGMYIFPLPDGAAVSEFSMFVDNEKIEGEVLDKNKARDIYEGIVRRMRDPALLEYIDRNTFKARVYPIPANSDKRIQIGYEEVIKCDNGLCKYIYPLDTERFSSKNLESVIISVKIHSKQAIKSIYSPSHEIEVDRTDDHNAVVTYKAKNLLPDKDFTLYYTVSEDDIGINLLTHDDYFMLMLAPRVEVESDKISKKDVVFVIDKSGSMSGEKIAQAKKALNFCLENLNEGDRFNIIAFSTDVITFEKELQEKHKTKITTAREFVDNIKALGGTNINEALLTAIKQFDEDERQHMIIFLTDGLPTIGETNYEKIIKNVAAKNKNIHIFAFGLGYDVNTKLLDTLSKQNHGVSEYVKPDEDIEVKVSSFYMKVSDPVLSNIKLQVDNAKIYNYYPKEVPDIFKGGQVLIIGRYKNGVNCTITLSGTVGKETHTYVYKGMFEKTTANEFIPRLWAQRRIAYLLDEIRLNGEDKELVEEIVKLSKQYGIITPYTSFLVAPEAEKDEYRHWQSNAATPSETLSASRSLSSAFTPLSGASAIKTSEQIQYLGTTATEHKSEEIKAVGSKVFIKRGGVWLDTTYSENKAMRQIKYGSDLYFETLHNNTNLGRYFAIGKSLIICDEDSCIKVGEDSGDSEGSIPVIKVLGGEQNVPLVPSVLPQNKPDDKGLVAICVLLVMMTVAVALLKRKG